MTLENNWRGKTIENLEKQNFGNPNEAPTNMVKRCLELCKVPLNQFTVEDLRLMIGQDFSLRYLIPLATEHLKENIFIEGDLYPGDLLKMFFRSTLTSGETINIYGRRLTN
jgi:hypothetical protein